MAGRIGLNDITPTVACGRYPSKAVVGAPVEITATVFREGHDAVAANVVWRPPADPVTGRRPREAAGPLHRMTRTADWSTSYTATVVPDRPGLWSFVVEAWSDPLNTWRHAVEVKAAAGQGADELANDLETGARLLETLAARPRQRYTAAISVAVDALRDGTRSVAERLGPALADELWSVLQAEPIRELVTKSPAQQVWVDVPLAESSAWYEFFPRSVGAEIDVEGRPLRHGTFRESIGMLDRIAAMGFDIVYLPPIHPIGEVNRKGRNNTVTPELTDVGSPWAIGSRFGGHDAVHPELGTLEDFDAFVAAATERGLTIALDLALQCAPDHPWVAEHPEWFTTRPDGSIAYAENPPKKYQDIYPLNFDNDPQGLYAEVLRVVQHWIDHGVRVFRVDNPHTKPIDFWEWLIAQVHRQHPDVIFLAEAFTKPAMMHELGRLGFTQSYTYFTWRNAKQELIDYAVELVEASDYMRPNFWPNTPDILHEALQHGGPANFAIRATLAATLSPSWGVYSGFELFEHRAVRVGSEEYLDSEKYQLRPRDYAAALSQGGSLEPYIGRMNAVRRAHPALQRMKGLWFHGISNDQMLCFSRHDPVSGDTVIVVVTLDPFKPQSGETALDMAQLGMSWDERFEVVDELSGETYQWGERNFVLLDPHWRTAHVLTVRRPEPTPATPSAPPLG
ncbi:alpha-1,4-glucan--maltose-1-phosphate maltosyltransferase [Nakamurella leprariae]|uniref:Alpha-1,4-glucan:maltose-1-phosphate maltosyltransferase n=1 Tax=Nakamurella leprariae TaxID=2803911 RepID=A0A939C160_9ACTN|nr:alpha-1,4-glucan--maltose-1-phosphate maltosyltransferase [Nakamurella leprariae]MBM9466842.1 alpha-1,4-glucan--maltose-1-phosphate maltosyltransferase [Nakamurella leprariae]